MPEMSRLERAFCQSPPWRVFARRAVLPWALQRVDLEGDVLEIGAGSGAMAERIAEEFPEIRVTATDYDPAMVEVARGRLSRFGDRVTVEQADATALQFPDRCFDAVLSFIMLHHVMEWERAVTETARVLRAGGRLVGYDLVASKPARWLHQVQRERHRLMARADFRRLVEDGLPFEAVSIRPALAGMAVRFQATRRDDPAGTDDT